MRPRYSAQVAFSIEDGEYIATSPEWPGLSGINRDPAEAVEVLYEAIVMSVEVYQEERRPLPAPRYHADADRRTEGGTR